MAALEPGKRLASSSVEDRLVIRSPHDVANLLSGEMASLPQEDLRVLLLTTKNHVAAVRAIYVGTVNTSLVRTAEVFRPAIRENYPSIILAHNHPSRDPTPSRQDIELTKSIRDAGELLNADVMDHIIIARNGFTSIKERGWDR